MDAAGMSIQSHGYDHVYLTDLDPDTLRERLHAARLRIEDGVGAADTLLAPPGGRMPAGLAATAGQCGYRHVLSSRPGRIRAARHPAELPRLAVSAPPPGSRPRARDRRSGAAGRRQQLRRRAL